MLRGSEIFAGDLAEIFSVLGDEHAFFVSLPDLKIFQIVKHNKIRPETRRDRAEISQAIMARGVDAGDLQRGDRRQAELDGFADAMINVAFVHEIARELVIGREGTILRIMRVDERQQDVRDFARCCLRAKECAGRAAIFRAPRRASVDS